MMRKKTHLDQIPFVFSEASDTLNQEGEPVLTMELHWPEGDDGCPKKLARLLALSASVWAARWRGVLYPRACAALAACRERSRPFTPWVCRLESQVTYNENGLFCAVWTASEQHGESRRSLLRYSLVWDCRDGAPRPLSSFFPGWRWRRQVLNSVTDEARQRLNSGESLLDHDLSGLRRHFSPRRFQLAEGRIEVYYPQCSIGAYAEGIPTFPVAELPHSGLDAGTESL